MLKNIFTLFNGRRERRWNIKFNLGSIRTIFRSGLWGLRLWHKTVIYIWGMVLLRIQLLILNWVPIIIKGFLMDNMGVNQKNHQPLDENQGSIENEKVNPKENQTPPSWLALLSIFCSSFDRFSVSLAMAAWIIGLFLFLSSFSWRWDILSIISLPLKKVVSEVSLLILMIHSSGFVSLVLAKPWTTVIVSWCLTTNWSILSSSSLDLSSLMNLASTSRLTQT